MNWACCGHCGNSFQQSIMKQKELNDFCWMVDWWPGPPTIPSIKEMKFLYWLGIDWAPFAIEEVWFCFLFCWGLWAGTAANAPQQRREQSKNQTNSMENEGRERERKQSKWINQWNWWNEIDLWMLLALLSGSPSGPAARQANAAQTNQPNQLVELLLLAAEQLAFSFFNWVELEKKSNPSINLSLLG